MPISRNHYALNSVVGVVEVILFSCSYKKKLNESGGMLGGGGYLHRNNHLGSRGVSVIYRVSGKYGGILGAASNEEL